MWTSTRRVSRAGGCCTRVTVRTIGLASTGGSTRTIVFGFAGVVLLLLASLPLLSDLLEFCVVPGQRCTLIASAKDQGVGDSANLKNKAHAV